MKQVIENNKKISTIIESDADDMPIDVPEEEETVKEDNNSHRDERGVGKPIVSGSLIATMLKLGNNNNDSGRHLCQWMLLRSDSKLHVMI